MKTLVQAHPAPEATEEQPGTQFSPVRVQHEFADEPDIWHEDVTLYDLRDAGLARWRKWLAEHPDVTEESDETAWWSSLRVASSICWSIWVTSRSDRVGGDTGQLASLQIGNLAKSGNLEDN